MGDNKTASGPPFRPLGSSSLRTSPRGGEARAYLPYCPAYGVLPGPSGSRGCTTAVSKKDLSRNHVRVIILSGSKQDKHFR